MAKPTGTSFVQAALAFLGTPYVWGGASPKGFDCSGLVEYVLTKMGVKNVPRTSEQQYAWATPISASQLQPGDLVFLNFPGEMSPGHVMIWLGNDKVLQAPGTGQQVQVSKFSPKAPGQNEWGATVVGYGRIPGLSYQGEPATVAAPGGSATAAAGGQSGGGATAAAAGTGCLPVLVLWSCIIAMFVLSFVHQGTAATGRPAHSERSNMSSTAGSTEEKDGVEVFEADASKPKAKPKASTAKPKAKPKASTAKPKAKPKASTPRSKFPVLKTEAACEKVMKANLDSYKQYQVERDKNRNEKGMAKHKLGYRTYKNAYTQLLAIRKAAGKGRRNAKAGA